MNIGTLFWILMIIWLIFGLWLAWPVASGLVPLVPNLLLWILLALLGWKTFGPILKA